MSTHRLTITKPDDFHVHLRDADALKTTVRDTALRFSRALVMPNLAQPIVTTDQALKYRERILEAVPKGVKFTPLMSLYLTEATSLDEVSKAVQSKCVHGIKLYPAGATTHSSAGVKDIKKCYPIFEKMQASGLPLLIHGEVTDPNIDIFDRERVFIERHLLDVRQKFPELKIILEHITTRDAVDFILGSNALTAATITAHHLSLNRNAMFEGGLRPHHYCLPVLKREEHRLSLLKAATSGSPKFFLGTDSAPHSIAKKEAACGCAGIYTAHFGIEIYASIFSGVGKLEALEPFSSFYGADFYGLPRNTEKITIIQKSWTVPTKIAFGSEELSPMHAGFEIDYQIE